MTGSASVADVLDRDFLRMRAKLIELAAALDRLDRADGAAGDDPRVQAIRKAIDVLASDRADRAAQIQLIFSRPYDEQWRERMGVG